jgi:hypothetical protein
MATRTRTYKVCDGCGRDTLNHNYILIVSTKTVPQLFGPPKTVDICVECDEAGKYYCRLCLAVHTDDSPCDAKRREIERAEAYAKEMNR